MKSSEKKKILNKVTKVLLSLCFIFLVAVFVLNIVLSVNMYAKDTVRLSEDITRRFTSSLSQSITDMTTDFEGYKKICSEYENNDQYAMLLNELKGKADTDEYLGFTIFTTHGAKQTEENQYYESYNAVYIEHAINQNKPLYYLYYNKLAMQMCVSYYCPMNTGNGIKLLSGVKPLLKIIADNSIVNEIVNTYEGEVYFVDNGGSPSNGYMTINNDGIKSSSGLIYEKLLDKYSQEVVDTYLSLKNKEFASSEMTIGESTYTLTRTRFGLCATSDVFVKLNKSKVLLTGNKDISKVIILLVLTFILFLIIMFLMYIKWSKTEKDKKVQENFNKDLNCSTYAKFEKDAVNTILNNRSIYYAVVSLSNTSIKFIRDRFGEPVQNEFRKYVSGVISSVLKHGETYCWLEKDIFVLLVYCEVKAECVSKLALIKEVINRFSLFRKNNFTVQFSTGIYYVTPQEKIDISLFVERSNIAMMANKQNPAKSFNEFTSELYEEYHIQSKIEANMESALKNEDFYVFFQPKYNIKEDRIDGAETLLRWYDKERDGFIRPAKFVKVFEINGFINKLDRYVFVKTCQFLDSAVKNGLKVTPISVNVSRVTATQKDFISFYKQVKEQYNIPDGYITIEFTESFSFTDMDVLSKIVDEMKKNGFQCSIDDFGSGYSSCGILKELDMDELKLDMFLLRPSQNSEKDKSLISMMINLGKAFNMKVTQEGVETMEQLNMLVKMGCDVIQGFLYSKPLIADDFLTFINGKTDMKTAIENSAKNIYKPIKYVEFSVDKNNL